MIAIAAHVERLDDEPLRMLLREHDDLHDDDDGDDLPHADSARVVDWTVARICACARTGSSAAA